MKKIIRMLVFSGVALYINSLWNKGFNLHITPLVLFKASFLLGLVYYLIAPLLKILLLPLNIITFGFVSVIAYLALINFIFTRFSLVQIHAWEFPGLHTWLIYIPKVKLNYWTNLILISFSLSTIINLLEFFL